MIFLGFTLEKYFVALGTGIFSFNEGNEIYVLPAYNSLSDTHMGKLCLLKSMQKFIEIKVWLLLTFFICLHNQLSSIHPIDTYQREHMFVKGYSSNTEKMNGCSFQPVLRQNLSWILS